MHWFGRLKSLTSYFWPSQSKERIIVFTDSDFISAGDYLVTKCASWSWESAGDLSKQKTHLPSDKQFLILRDVPCLRRAFSYEEGYEIVGSGGEDDARLLIHGDPSESKDEDNLLSTEKSPELGTENPFLIIDSYFSVDKIPYMAKFPAVQESTHRVVHDSEDMICPRTYDISITYDNDHNTFHFWLTGYYEDGRPLQPELILQDVRKNHVGKTVTIEDHPYLPGKHASVHPKIHGAAVKKMVEDQTSDGIVPEVNKCLSLSLEFVASVFPTIIFDATWVLDLESSSN